MLLSTSLDHGRLRRGRRAIAAAAAATSRFCAGGATPSAAAAAASKLSLGQGTILSSIGSRTTARAASTALGDHNLVVDAAAGTISIAAITGALSILAAAAS